MGQTYRKGQMIGELVDGVLTKTVRRSKHLYRKFDGWGIDAEAFEGWLDRGMHSIRIEDTEDNVVYEIAVEDFALHGREIQYGDFGRQLVCGRKYFETTQM